MIVNFSGFVLYQISATSIHGNVMFIYNELPVKTIPTMNKILNYAIVLCSTVYPVVALTGYWTIFKFPGLHAKVYAAQSIEDLLMTG